MRVNVLYFTILRDRAGVRQETVELPEGATVGDLRTRLASSRPALSELLPTAIVAVNRDFARPEVNLSDGDEVAIFPPVSGGGQTPGPTVLEVTEAELDFNALLQQLVLPTTGAACVFTGVVRAHTERGFAHQTDYLEYQAYRPMALDMMQRVADEIRERWPMVEGIAIVQRVGRLDPGTPTVIIACTAAHRDTGVFEAARYGIDRLKEIVPVWKKEVGPDGEAWVAGEHRPDLESDRG